MNDKNVDLMSANSDEFPTKALKGDAAMSGPRIDALVDIPSMRFLPALSETLARRSPSSREHTREVVVLASSLLNRLRDPNPVERQHAPGPL